MLGRCVVEDSASSSEAEEPRVAVVERWQPPGPAPAAPPAPVEAVSLESVTAVLEAPLAVGRVLRSFGDGLVLAPLGALLRLGEPVFGAVEPGRFARVGCLDDVFGSLERYFYLVALDPALRAHFPRLHALSELLVDARTAQFVSPAELAQLRTARGSDAQFDADQGLPVESSDEEEPPRRPAPELAAPERAKRPKPAAGP